MKKVEIFLDCGAFSAKTQGKSIDMDAYIKYIKEHPEIDYYCSLDVLTGVNQKDTGEETFQNYLYMKKAGLHPIPVYHSNADEKYLEYYIKDTDFVAIGAVSSLNVGEKYLLLERLWRKYLCDDKGYPKLKVHGFGITARTLMCSFPWYSVDSTSWVAFSRFGIILVPVLKGGKWNYLENPWTVCVSRRSPTINIVDKDSAEKNFHNFTKQDQEVILKYVSELGFVMGESKIEDVSFTKGKKGKVIERVITEGASNSTRIRDKINLFYYLQLQLSIPEYPWAMKSTIPMLI